MKRSRARRFARRCGGIARGPHTPQLYYFARHSGAGQIKNWLALRKLATDNGLGKRWPESFYRKAPKGKPEPQEK